VKQCFPLWQNSEFIINVIAYNYLIQQKILTCFLKQKIPSKYRTCSRFMSTSYFHIINSKTILFVYQEDMYRLSSTCTCNLYCYTANSFFDMASITWDFTESSVFWNILRYANLKICLVCFEVLFSDYRALTSLLVLLYQYLISNKFCTYDSLVFSAKSMIF